MLEHPNALQWNEGPGHYEVYYVTLTTAALWVLAMDPASGAGAPTIGRKATFAVRRLSAQREPFELRIEDAILTDSGMSGSIDDVSWDLRWDASGHPSGRRGDEQCSRVAHRPLVPCKRSVRR